MSVANLAGIRIHGDLTIIELQNRQECECERVMSMLVFLVRSPNRIICSHGHYVRLPAELMVSPRCVICRRYRRIRAAAKRFNFVVLLLANREHRKNKSRSLVSRVSCVCEDHLISS